MRARPHLQGDMTNQECMPYSQSTQTWITQFYLQITPCLPFLCKRAPDGAIPNWGSRHPVAAYYAFIDPKGWKAELAWLVDP